MNTGEQSEQSEQNEQSEQTKFDVWGIIFIIFNPIIIFPLSRANVFPPVINAPMQRRHLDVIMQ